MTLYQHRVTAEQHNKHITNGTDRLFMNYLTKLVIDPLETTEKYQ